MAQRLFDLALAPTTLQSYTSAFQRYQLFCLHASLQPFPVSEHNLVLFCTHLSCHVAAKTIKSYFSGIRFHSVALGHYFNVSSMPRLYYVLRGIKRSQGNSHCLPLRQPITMVHLRRLLSWLQTSNLPLQDRHLWWSACTLAFFGLLRASEYTAPTVNTFAANFTLGTSDIRFNTDFTSLLVFIKASKTDPFRVGCTIHIGSTNNQFCPVNAMRVFLRSRSTTSAVPLFVFADDSFLTRSRMSSFILSVLGGTNLNTHSFRIGGATALAVAGFSDAHIQTIGRWSSNCFQRYIRLSSDILRHYTSSMCSRDIGAACWDPLS